VQGYFESVDRALTEIKVQRSELLETVPGATVSGRVDVGLWPGSAT